MPIHLLFMIEKTPLTRDAAYESSELIYPFIVL